MTAQNPDVLSVDRAADLPTFCALAFQDDDPSVVAWIDFWAVEPCSSIEADYARGRRYGEEAIRHVRITGQDVFIECVLMSIGIKLRQRNRCAGGLEQGFIDCIADDFPGAADRVMTRLLRRYPRALN